MAESEERDSDFEENEKREVNNTMCKGIREKCALYTGRVRKQLYIYFLKFLGT